ncbi:MAG: OmpA family protein [Bacteroidales bacterium]|nr:OmpA family protein [Bacteroidales bacterium]
MRHRFIYLLLTVFAFMIFNHGVAQPPALSKKVLDLGAKARKSLEAKKFQEAEKYLQRLFAIDTTYGEAHVIQGDLYNISLQPVLAAQSYNKAIACMYRPKPILFFITACEELKCARYDSALSHFQTYIQLAPNDYSVRGEVEDGIATCRFGIEAMKHPVIFNPVNLGANINSEWDEYLAALTADEQELIFTVRRPRDEETICPFCQTEEDFYSSVKKNQEWQPRQFIPAPINSHYNEGAQTISPDGRYLFYTLCNTDFGYGSCDLYWAKRIGNRWSRPRNFGEPVNSKYWESQPSIAPDGKTIYFASNRPGGYGGIDLWKTEMLDEGKFSPPINLGPMINTKKDDAAPFIHADGQTLYFASDGHPGMGNKDIFYAVRNGENGWSKPVNMGYPINTPNDEINILINAAGTTAYYSSDKEGGYGGIDLYAFELDERLRPTPVTYIKGIIRDADSHLPLPAHISIIDLKDNQLLTSTFSDPETGEFLACLRTGDNLMLHVNHPRYPFYSENFQIPSSYSQLNPFLKDIFLRAADIGNVFVLRNIFFDFNESKLKQESYLELDNLVTYLQHHQSLHIEIGGHTDNVGNDAYNLQLSQARAKSVYDYLISQGIVANRLTYKGYGESKPIEDNLTEEGRATNRRTEFVITEK